MSDLPDLTVAWYVQGDPDQMLFEWKIDAERYARELFPDEDPDRRYARVFYKTVYRYVRFGDGTVGFAPAIGPRPKEALS